MTSPSDQAVSVSIFRLPNTEYKCKTRSEVMVIDIRTHYRHICIDMQFPTASTYCIRLIPDSSVGILIAPPRVKKLPASNVVETWVEGCVELRIAACWSGTLVSHRDGICGGVSDRLRKLWDGEPADDELLASVHATYLE